MKEPHFYTPEEIKELNSLVQQWANNTRRRLKSSAKGSLSAHLSSKNKYDYGLIQAAGFEFRRYGVFVEMGVFGGLSRDEAKAQGKLKPQPWFNPVVREDVPKLLDKLQDKFAELVDYSDQLEIKNV